MADTKRTIDKITKARERLLLAIEGLTEEQMTWSPDGEWSIQEILQHVGIAERANVELAKRALAGNPVAMDNFDLDSWNYAVLARRPWSVSRVSPTRTYR